MASKRFSIYLLAASSVLSSVTITDAISSTKIRVCQGSSCLGKCRGSFNPLTAFNNLQKDESAETSIEIEETWCMNQCKRGPNARITKDGNVLTFEEGKMNDTEMKRKSFQGIGSEERVGHVWGLARGIEDGTVLGILSGSVDKLTDIMP